MTSPLLAAAPPSTVHPAGHAARWVARSLLIVWAGFWLWFNIASMVGERDGAQPHLALALITVALAVTCWCWPRIGGVLMIAAGVFAARAFPHTAAFLLLAVPGTAIGVLLLLLRR